jgi:hypothetical protein
MEDATRLRAKADQARRLGAGIGNPADRENLIAMAEAWEAEAAAVEAAEALQPTRAC